MEITKVVKLLKLAIHPGQLELGIICDCNDLRAAQLFVQTLHPLPKLRSCALRLSSLANEAITRLAERMVARLTGKDEEIDVSGWLSGWARLSADIRRQILGGDLLILRRILEFTDVVAPTDLNYNPSWPDGGFNLQFHRNRKLHICKPINGWTIFRVSSASSCRCWSFPRSLFQVSNDFRRAAHRVFWSKNHFIMLCTKERKVSYLDNDGLDFHQLLKPFNPITIGFLRSLQITMPLNPRFLLRPTDEDTPDIQRYDMPCYWSH